MITDQVNTVNELINRLKNDDISGTIEIIIRDKGKQNRILVRKQDEEDKINEEINRIKLSKPDLSHADFSNVNLSGSNFSGLDLHETNFAYSRIVNTNLAGSNLKDSSFYKAVISQSDFSYSSGINTNGAYLTGSVNLYSAGVSGVPGHYGRGTSAEAYRSGYGEQRILPNNMYDYGEHPSDMSNIPAPRPKRNY